MLTEQGPQANHLDPKCTAESLVLYILQPTRLTGCQFGTGEYGEFPFNGFIVQQTVEGI